MTPEEIKKIAEEYAVIPSSLFSKEYYRRLGEANSVLEFLTARFYLVEKGKVKEELISALKRCRNQDHYDGAYETLQSLFGPDIRKEEEE